MRRIIIFLGLKVDEIWRGLKVLGQAILAITALGVGSFGMIWIIEKTMTLDFLAMAMTYSILVVCISAVILFFKDWIVDNWKTAGEMLENENLYKRR